MVTTKASGEMTHVTLEMLATPALVLDQPKIERNIARLAEYGRQHNIGIRPHTKTHKSRLMSQWQCAAGAIGLTTAKVGEAEVMADVCQDLTIAYPAIDPARTKRLAELAARGITVRVALDGPNGLDALNAAARNFNTKIGVLVDLDVGFHRTGLQTPAATMELAQEIARHANLRLDGLFCYPGHVWLPSDEQAEELGRIEALLAETLDLWRSSGLNTETVSGGSTPTAYQSHLMPSLTEIRPGTTIYNDMNTVYGGYCELEDCAATIICTVVSDAVPGKVVIDAGTKTLTSDRNARRPESGHGYVVEYPQAKIVRLSEEHGEIDISECDVAPTPGERVTVIPNHICPCVNLQDHAWLQSSDGTLRSLPTDARGRLS